MENVKTLDKQTAAFLGVLIQQMPRLTATEMQRYIERPRELSNLLSDAFLSPSFKTWPKRLQPYKIIKTGRFKNIEDACKEIEKEGIVIKKEAGEVIKKIVLEAGERDIKIVLLSLKDMLFNGHEANYGDICKRAKDLGLELCPAEVALQLRPQNENREIFIAMEPITNSPGNLSILKLEGGFKPFNLAPSIDICPAYLQTTWMISLDNELFAFVLSQDR